MSAPSTSTGPTWADPTPDTLPGEISSTLLIARRAALEALRDRMTLIMSLVFSLVLPLFLVVAVVGPMGQQHAALLAFYVLLVGLLPSTSAVGIASGQFAGEKEHGNLQPLLVSPASNSAIFGGKVLGAIIPAMIFAAVGECVYLGSLVATLGIGTLHLVPLALALAMIGLVPGTTLFAAAVASLISSRVRTFNAAQQIGGFALIPLWAAIFGLGTQMVDWGIGGLIVAVVGVFVVDVILVRVAAATWRREEVLAQQ